VERPISILVVRKNGNRVKMISTYVGEKSVSPFEIVLGINGSYITPLPNTRLLIDVTFLLAVRRSLSLSTYRIFCVNTIGVNQCFYRVQVSPSSFHHFGFVNWPSPTITHKPPHHNNSRRNREPTTITRRPNKNPEILSFSRI